MTALPIEPVLPDLAAALDDRGIAVLEAPPGAGKTTRVPLYLLEVGAPGRIVMLEPRRLATRAAAERMAHTLRETPGGTVGYAMRGDRKVGPGTRIEVVTEGLLTRRLQSDPDLPGVGTLIFDEFHERSLQADLGLALALEARAALRPDLRILVMSATLDAGAVAAMLDAPVITARGRSYPVDLRHLGAPWQSPDRHRPRYEAAVAGLVHKAVAETEGGVLVFLPGEAEIKRVAAGLTSLGEGTIVHRLYGALPPSAQRVAIAPAPHGRKVVLATAIAETSLTIEDVRVVVDGGRARRPRFDAGSGMARLITERVTAAEATQRAGRAGRVAPGVCYRLWTKGEEGALAPFPLPEILSADLTGFVLELAAWGTRDLGALAFLDPPREADITAARDLLTDLGALEPGGAITDHGRRLAALPLHPRLGHMLTLGGAGSDLMAALFEARDPLPRAAPVDLTLRLDALRDTRRFETETGITPRVGALTTIRAETKRLKPQGPDRTPGEQAALAYPDRIGLRRPGDAPRYLLSGGKGAVLDTADPLAGTRMLVAVNLDGDTREARIRLAIPVTETEIRGLFPDRIRTRDICRWSKRHRRVEARRQTCLGALVLADERWRDAPPDARAQAMAEGVADMGLDGLPWSDAARRLQARVARARAVAPTLPDLSDAALARDLNPWLTPYLMGIETRSDLGKLDLVAVLRAQLDRGALQTLDRIAPAAVTAPTGTRLLIDYASDPPRISVKLQELFGLTRHPEAGGAPLLIELLSPAGRPVQTTADLPGFWARSYHDVRKDMRGRYPKHPWPEDPTTAPPTRRAKPRTKG
ncbi:MAG: ATP-dependent helicase HrpB [Pseudomonadota bacterium]